MGSMPHQGNLIKFVYTDNLGNEKSFRIPIIISGDRAIYVHSNTTGRIIGCSIKNIRKDIKRKIVKGRTKLVSDTGVYIKQSDLPIVLKAHINANNVEIVEQLSNFFAEPKQDDFNKINDIESEYSSKVSKLIKEKEELEVEYNGRIAALIKENEDLIAHHQKVLTENKLLNKENMELKKGIERSELALFRQLQLMSSLAFENVCSPIIVKTEFDNAHKSMRLLVERYKLDLNVVRALILNRTSVLATKTTVKGISFIDCAKAVNDVNTEKKVKEVYVDTIKLVFVMGFGKYFFKAIEETFINGFTEEEINDQKRKIAKRKQ